ncbi:MAG: terminase gpA endonuclease subunit [Pirellulales bacterium]
MGRDQPGRGRVGRTHDVTGPGIVPKDTRQLTGGIDLGKRLAHWVLVAWGPGATGQVIDYGRISVASDELGTEQAILEVLQSFRAQVAAGVPTEGGSARRGCPIACSSMPAT